MVTASQVSPMSRDITCHPCPEKRHRAMRDTTGAKPAEGGGAGAQRTVAIMRWLRAHSSSASPGRRDHGRVRLSLLFTQ